MLLPSPGKFPPSPCQPIILTLGGTESRQGLNPDRQVEGVLLGGPTREVLFSDDNKDLCFTSCTEGMSGCSILLGRVIGLTCPARELKSVNMMRHL